MEIDHDKIDEAVLALLWKALHDERWAWKGFDWDVIDRLYQKSFIANPANNAKSVVFTGEGLQKAEGPFKSLFTRKPCGPDRDSLSPRTFRFQGKSAKRRTDASEAAPKAGQTSANQPHGACRSQ